MTTPLTINVPDDLMQQLRELAERQLRTPEQQALWLIKLAVDPVLGGSPAKAADRRERHQAAARTLRAELRSLWMQHGGPSSRVVAQMVYEKTAARVSHTTVSVLLNGSGNPTWPVLEKVVKALDGDTGHFGQLWAAANPSRSAEDLR